MRELSKDELQAVSGGLFEEYGYAMDSGGGDYYGDMYAATSTCDYTDPRWCTGSCPRVIYSPTATIGIRG